MKKTRFECYLQEVAPYWEEYLKNRKTQNAYKVFKKHADRIVAKIIEEEQKR